MFINSEHIFDKEDSIEPLIEELNITYDNFKIENYSFIDSRDNLLIQLSDIIVGLIGKFYNYINDNTLEKLRVNIKSLNGTQKDNLKLFNKLLYDSEIKNKAYIHLTISNDELKKMEFIRNYA